MRLTPGPNLPLLLIPPLLCALLADLWLAGPWMFLLALALTALPALVDLLRLQRCQPEIRVERRLRRSLPLNVWSGFGISLVNATTRSEERRVGKECRSRWSPYH